jgi:hypothetical protein
VTSTAIRIANCSGFYGDRLSAAREMVDGGPIDVLTGDWLAELTMLILAKQRRRAPETGYARTFLTEVEEVLGTCLERGIKIVSNAGGLNPAGCAAAVREIADRLGLRPVVAHVEGDDLLPRLDELRAQGVTFDHLDTGAPLADVDVMTANAYLGGWGIVDALERGADVVVTGRTTDAALVIGPAAWHHRWARDDWDALAGALAAGHVIECGAQATGGNYSFFDEVPDLTHPGFPIAEVAEDGSAVITKHAGQGGAVTVGTVTAQLLYEIRGPRYANPDVTALFDTLVLEDAGPDRVRLRGTRGLPPPPTTKVSLNFDGGWRTTTTVYFTGIDVEAKAELFERALWASIEGGRDAFDEVEVHLMRTDHDDPATNEAAVAQLRMTVKDRDERKVGRAFGAKVTEIALCNFPGMFKSPEETLQFGVYWPAIVPNEVITQVVDVEGARREVPACPPAAELAMASATASPSATSHEREVPPAPSGPTARVPLGRLVGARSGDKGGLANVGVWCRTDDAYAWLSNELTVERLRELMPAETTGLEVERYELPNLRALNFVIVGLLGEGVASSGRLDAQAKGLGEYLRAKVVDIPTVLL